ncbi:hypothetical protein ACFSTE_12250 [Aquimarina hainanensis]|uniref:Uncharacterized protein n=1 Tax=Aquimarina hainanensis TaxID=1578017 RepID=A0ABW5NB15_9FLAO
MERHTTANHDISTWKGTEISLFREDLLFKTKGSISEKSFYSYFKKDSNKLPRIDVLHLFAQYCGYQNWNDFLSNNRPAPQQKQLNYKKWLFLLGSTGAILGTLWVFFFTPTPSNTFSFCFIDQDREERIINPPISIKVLNSKESPFDIKSDSTGCFSWTTKDDFVRFSITSPYYKDDTIYRSYTKHQQEQIQVKTDDYALMLHYYVNGKIEDWKKRRKELHKILADEATIFKILPHGVGVEMFSKDDFINTLTTPTQELKNIRIIDSKRVNGKIVMLKFKSSL